MLCPIRLDIAAFPGDVKTLINFARVREHVRIADEESDALLAVYVRAAMLWAEAATHRSVVARSHAWVLRDFNLISPYEMRLPRGKTVSVENIAYSNSGSITTLYGPTGDFSPAGTDYQEDLRGDGGGVVMPARGRAWPSVDSDVPAPVVINFTAGYEADAMPDDLFHAIMFAVADLYDLRGTPDFEPSMLSGAGPKFAARQALISGYMLPRVY